jgi:homeobox protein cut-like
LEALEQRYEASVDPFRQFSRAERQRKLNEMSPMERIVFVVAKTVLGSKGMRTGLFFYVLAMHLLVFVTTYHWSHQEGCGQHNMMDKEQLSHLPPDHQQAAAVAQAAVAQTIASN